MRYAPIAFCLFLSILPLGAGTLPLTAKDVSLMLRGGDSNAVVMQELARRRFADTLDAEKEKVLFKAGATPELISTIESGAYALSPEQLAWAKQEMAEMARRRAALAEESKRFNTLYQDQLVKDRAAALLASQGANATYDYLKGCLVRLSPNSVMRVDDDAIGKKKLILYYFSAHWCAPCRKFTPKLVDYYNRVAPQHPEFEIVFYSFDKSAADMEHYMREVNMPWPAIDYDKRLEKEELTKAAGTGIPSLVLVSGTGQLISSSYSGSKYRGTEKVLEDLDGVFATGKWPQIVQAPGE